MSTLLCPFLHPKNKVVRTLIYEYLFVLSNPITIWVNQLNGKLCSYEEYVRYPLRPGMGALAEISAGPFTGLLRTHTQIHDEAIVILYGDKNTFKFDSLFDLRIWVAAIGRRPASVLKNIIIDQRGTATSRGLELQSLAVSKRLKSLEIHHMDVCMHEDRLEHVAKACMPLMRDLDAVYHAGQRHTRPESVLNVYIPPECDLCKDWQTRSVRGGGAHALQIAGYQCGCRCHEANERTAELQTSLREAIKKGLTEPNLEENGQDQPGLGIQLSQVMLRTKKRGKK